MLSWKWPEGHDNHKPRHLWWIDSGSCFPAAFGGACSGTPPECRECNKARCNHHNHFVDCRINKHSDYNKARCNLRHHFVDCKIIQIVTKPGGHQLSILIIANAVHTIIIIIIESIVVEMSSSSLLLKLGYNIVNGRVLLDHPHKKYT